MHRNWLGVFFGRLAFRQLLVLVPSEDSSPQGHFAGGARWGPPHPVSVPAGSLFPVPWAAQCPAVSCHCS